MLNRRRLLATSTVAAATILPIRASAGSTPSAAPPVSPVASPAASPAASPVVTNRRLGTCGIKYDLGSENARNVLTRPASDEQFYREELTAIRDQLHCDKLDLYGSDPTLLVAALGIAADLGFDISVQTRFNFLPESAMRERLTTIAREAERIRKAGIPVVLDVGCEYLTFADGLIPGDDIFEKIEAINAGNVDWEVSIPAFLGLLQSLAETARAHFGGPITYSDTPDVETAWDAFDIIGIDHYLSAENRSSYVQTIDALAATGKPVWIREFGSPPWKGAAEVGGMAWDIVDYEADPPRIRDGIIRDEQVQADAMLRNLGLIGQSKAERAYLYEFITSGSTRSTDPRYDYDLTGYGIVSTWGPDAEKPYETTGYWEPKEAFHRLAAWNQDK